MDSRLIALRGKLAAALNKAAGATLSSKHMSDMEKLSQQFGAIHMRNTLHKLVELNQMGQAVDLQSDQKSPSTTNSRNDISKKEGITTILKPSTSDTPVKYSVSPAKVAQVERQSSTESEESFYSSEDDRPSVERSRTLIRSASPRRSASPMRRVQIGRSGSRRAAALTIKSLNYFPARDKTSSYRDASVDSSEEEESEQTPKNSISHAKRMSVQDAINLFENKRDQTMGGDKRRSTVDVFASTSRSVLRRWSAGKFESSAEIVSESPALLTSDSLDGERIPRSSYEANPESEFISGDVDAAKVDASFDASEENKSTLKCRDTLVFERKENTEKLTASAEWNRQKEAELNQMLMKMMESKPVRYQNVAPDNNRSRDVPLEQREESYDQYKEKRDEKLQGATARKRAEKDAQFRATQQILDKRKGEVASFNRNDVGKRSSVAKPQKSYRSSTQSANAKKESPKPTVKKTLSKASPAPAVRRSWPSAPSPRAATGIPSVKTPHGTSSSGTTSIQQKSLPTLLAPRSTQKLDKSLQQPKNVKASQNGAKKSMKGATEKQQQPSTKSGRTTKSKVETTSGKDRSTIAAKPTFNNKVAKKSTVVPLESKPFLRKGSGIGPGGVKTKASTQREEKSNSSVNLIQAQENEAVTNTQENEAVISTSNPASQHQEECLEALDSNANLETETQVTSQLKRIDTVSNGEVTASVDDSFVKAMESALKSEAEEEPVISPKAWIEIEEHQDSSTSHDNNTCQVASAADAAQVSTSSQNIRQSLSQMLLEESAEPDIVEWGNAQHPPVMVYQKDAPKGLKKLLKFARKGRPDPNLAGWSSPSIFSEGEDDAEDSKAVARKSSDNLLWKAAIHGKNYYGRRRTSLGGDYEKSSAGPEILSAQPNTRKFGGHSSSYKLQDHVSAGAASSKGTRSFFSLSAFKGSKANETKLH